ncbi:hypothetical protein KBI23_03755 [bacterium]|nr:hypothetical protein [bacterium]MBP9810016.1 hypothetical protein [bacterium]
MLQELETISILGRPAATLSLVPELAAETISPVAAAAPADACITPASEAALAAFKTRVDDLIGSHPIVNSNQFTSWFSQGDASPEQLRQFTVQFSVFSHLFIEAQLRKCINAVDLASYRASKEILMNELGVMFTADGSIDNGRFRFTAAHFEWLAEFASHLGLEFNQIGKRKHGIASTLEFCDALMTWYSSDDESTAAGASHAIEHWAAAGFWKELIAGLKIIKESQLADLPLGFWVFHDQIEDQHAAHTDDELAAAFAKPDFCEEAFLAGGKAMLDAVAIFWNGLDEQCSIASHNSTASSCDAL